MMLLNQECFSGFDVSGVLIVIDVRAKGLGELTIWILFAHKPRLYRRSEKIEKMKVVPGSRATAHLLLRVIQLLKP